MLRWLGGGLLLTAPLFLTAKEYQDYLLHQRVLSFFCRILAAGAEEISVSLCPLPQLLKELAQREAEPVPGFWQTLQGVRQNFPVAWAGAIERCCLSKREQMLLRQLPEILRSYDTEQIGRELNRLEAELLSVQKQERDRFQRGFKVRTGFRFSAFLLLLILLV